MLFIIDNVEDTSTLSLNWRLVLKLILSKYFTTKIIHHYESSIFSSDLTKLTKLINGRDLNHWGTFTVFNKPNFLNSANKST